MASFELLPAIDLRGGRVVRLRQGDFDRETIYDADPAVAAAGFIEAGARWLHVVDLDGARAGESRQSGIIAEIVAAVAGRASVEVAGGLRTAAAVDAVFAAGASRAVVGTAALGDPSFVAGLVAANGASAIVVAIDVRDGLALGEGWRNGAPGVPLEAIVVRLADVGVTTFEVTAIERDGLLDGPDLDLLGRLVHLGRGRIIASGGIASIDDLLAVRALGCAGAIVGRALYEGAIDLRGAIAAVGGG